MFFKSKNKNKDICWEEKLEAMQSLSGVPPFGEPLLAYREGAWSCRIPGSINANRSVMLGDSGRGSSPEEAVSNAWKRIKSLTKGQFLETNTYPEKRYVRIVGCTFIDINPIE